MLKSSNWMPWQRWMFAVLRDLGLDRYIANQNVPGTAKEGQPTEEIEAQRKWTSKRHPNRFSDGWCRDDLHQWRNDSEEIPHHHDGKGDLGTLVTTRRELYRDTAASSFKFDMAEPRSTYQSLEITGWTPLNGERGWQWRSLPESWNNYRSSYLETRGSMPSFWTSFWWGWWKTY